MFKLNGGGKLEVAARALICPRPAGGKQINLLVPACFAAKAHKAVTP